jgi:glycosyltransferase involved in cell wall biosynthesis
MEQVTTKPLRAPARPPLRLEGGLDRVSPEGTLEGWIWAPDAPGPRVVVVTADGHVAGRATCNRPRADLAARPGAAGFLMRLPEGTLAPGKEVEIALRDHATGRQLGVPLVAGRILPPAAGPAGPLSGNVDRVTRDGWVSGWAWDPGQPEQRITLDILVDEAVVGTTAAMNWRADLQQAGIGDGSHGFSYALPYDVMARKGTMRVRVRETGSGRPLGQPALLRIGRLAESEQRVAELERQIRQLRGRVDELLRAAADRPAVEERQARALFAMVSSFFQELAEGTAPDARRFGLGRGVRATLDDLVARLPALTLLVPAVPQLVVLVPATAEVERAHRCLACLHAVGVDRIADIVVLDPGTDDRTALLPGLLPGLRYRRCAADGLAAACNEAVAASSAPTIAVLDPHVEVSPGTVQELLATLAAEPEAGAVGAALLRADGLAHRSAFRLAQGASLRDEPDEAVRFLRAADALPAQACAVSRAQFLRAGGFDPGFARLDHAMIGLCARMQTHGAAVLVQPTARALRTVGGEADLPDLTGSDEDARRLRLALLEAGERGAGERGGMLGRVLLVDDSIPRPDRDAGSVIALAQMTVLRRLGWHVVFAPASGPPAGDADRARLERAGIEAALPPDIPSVTEYLQEHGRGLDLAILVRHANFAALAPRVRELAPRAKLVFAPADLHFLRESREAALAGRKRETPALRKLRQEELGCVAAADATLVMSDYEQALLAAETDPAKIHLLRWIATLSPPTAGFAERDGLLFVGNFDHRPNVDAVLWYAEAILPELRRRRPGLVLHVAGSNPPRELSLLGAKDVVVHGWVADLDGLLDRVRLSVAPLRYGAGFKGKVPTSLARGVPVVGTTIAMEGTGLAPGDGIAVADDPARFAEAVIRLHDNAADWTLAAQRGRERVAALYSPALAARVTARMLAALGLPFRQPPRAASCPEPGSDGTAAGDGVVDP